MRAHKAAVLQIESRSLGGRRILRCRRWMLGAALGVVVMAGPARAQKSGGERLYVSAEDGGEVVVVDPVSATVVARIAVGKRPRGVKLSADGRVLYVALSGSPKAGPGVDESKLPTADRAADGIGAVDLATRTLLRVYPSGQDPEAFDVSRDGKLLFISNEETAEMSVLDLASGQVVRRVPVGREPEGVTVRPDGKVVYVTSEEESLVVAVDAAAWVPLARIPVGPRPRSLVVTPDGKTAFVPNEMQPTVTVVDLVRNRSLGSIAVVPVAKTVLGPRPMGAVLSRDARTLYVSTGRGESVAIIDVATRRQRRILDGVGARPWGIALGANGRFLYTANGPSNDVSIIDTSTGKIEKRIQIGGTPWGLAVSHPAPAAHRDAHARAQQ